MDQQQQKKVNFKHVKSQQSSSQLTKSISDKDMHNVFSKPSKGAIKSSYDQILQYFQQKDAQMQLEFEQQKESPNEQGQIIQQLDQWKNNIKQQKQMNENEFMDIKKNSNNLSHQQQQMEHSEKHKKQSIPEINQEMVNTITKQTVGSQVNIGLQKMKTTISTKDLMNYSKQLINQSNPSQTQQNNGEDENYNEQQILTFGVPVDNNNEKIKQQQAIPFLHRELNRKILNELLTKKLKQKYESSNAVQQSQQYQQDSQEDEDHQGIQRTQIQEDVKHLVLNETIDFTKNLGSSFKSVLKHFGKPEHAIQQKQVMQKLINQINRPKGLLKTQQQSLIGVENNEYYFAEAEKNLLEQYSDVMQEIKQQQEAVVDIMQQNSKLLEEIGRFKQLIVDLEHKKDEYDLSMQEMSSSKNQMQNSQGRLGFKKMTQMSKMTLQKQLNMAEIHMIQYKLNISKIQNQIEVNEGSVEQKQKDIKNNKMRKTAIKNCLKDIYYKMIKSDNNIFSKESLSWIVKALLRISEDIKLYQSLIFPYYLDNQSIEYLIKYSEIDLEIDTKIKQFNQIPVNHATIEKLDDFDLMNQQSLKVLKSKINSLTQKAKVIKPVYTLKENQKNLSVSYQLQDNPQEEKEMSLNQKKEIFYENKKNLELKHQSQLEIQKLKNQQQNLKKSEIDRLLNMFIREKITTRLNTYLQILQALFGHFEGGNLYQEFQYQKVNLREKIKKNQTFNFFRDGVSLNKKLNQSTSSSQQLETQQYQQQQQSSSINNSKGDQRDQDANIMNDISKSIIEQQYSLTKRPLSQIDERMMTTNQKRQNKIHVTIANQQRLASQIICKTEESQMNYDFDFFQNQMVNQTNTATSNEKEFILNKQKKQTKHLRPLIKRSFNFDSNSSQNLL